MSDKKNDGGPAFPCGSYDANTGCAQPPIVPGMSLRDYFAAAVLTGILANRCANRYDDYVKYAYQEADALLQERDR